MVVEVVVVDEDETMESKAAMIEEEKPISREEGGSTIIGSAIDTSGCEGVEKTSKTSADEEAASVVMLGAIVV